MGPHRTRQETAAALRRNPAPAPVDDSFVAVLADLASTSTAAPPARTPQTRIGLRLAAAVGAVAMITAGSAYAAHQLGHDPAPSPAPTSETHPPEEGVDEQTETPPRTTTGEEDRAPGQRDRTDGKGTASHGAAWDGQDESHEPRDESASNSESQDGSDAPQIATSSGNDHHGDETQDSTEDNDQGQDEDADQDNNQENDQDNDAGDENDGVEDDVPSLDADQDDDQHAQRTGDGDREPEDGEVTGDDDN